MRNHLIGLLLVGGLAGCTSEWDSDRVLATTSTQAADQGQALSRAALAAARGSQASFASLPDRGELMQYASDRQVRQSGAYTSHPVEISEAHALNAIAKGGMQINLPNGKTLDLKYASHEEQPDGNWSWIGHNEDGSSAVLTFGDKAVFGTISDGADEYRVRTNTAGAWIVATDRQRVAPGNGLRDEGTDYLLPPSRLSTAGHGAAAMGGRVLASAAPVAEKAAAVVDVLLGYSNGLVARVGSESGAKTLMANLIAATNTSYANSGVNMRVRLVHSMQVNYADTSDNEDALQKLTGYNAATEQPIPVDSAFTALRAARDEYGADLVSLVRSYREPEQNGCGVAWLLGMSGSAITAADDAPFGYSVVSDGTDVDESDNNTYFCSGYALAHELGHLMGQAHDRDNASHPGAHAYSYGYREAASSGFYTIMAYPRDDTQARNEAPHFANPTVSYSGRPTGVANTSDNVRSMNATMPIIATFRAQKVPSEGTRFDFNGDGRSDVMWWNAGARQFSYTVMNGTSRGASPTFPSYRVGDYVAAVGDANGDGFTDLISANAALREYWLGRNTGSSSFQWIRLGTYSPGWEIIGAADINADGRDDVLWWNAATRQFSYTLMNETSAGSSRVFPGYQPGESIVAIGDVDNDSRADLFVVNANTRAYFVGRNTGSGFQWRQLGTMSAGWQIIGSGDVNGDDFDDILWWNPTSRKFSHTLMNGTTRGASRDTAAFRPGDGINGFGDFNGDGRLDLISANAGSAEYYIGIGNGSTYQWTRIGTFNAATWSILRFR